MRADERFWEKVDKRSGCWLWQGMKVPEGFGRFYPTRDKTVAAHHYAWQLMYGIQGPLSLLHKCQNKDCVRPDHLMIAFGEEHFWQQVRRSVHCWEWQGSTRRGYGRWLGEPAHRFSWRLSNEIPEGLLVLHKCDNRKCVRPQHLFTGTQADNMADKVSKGRQAKGNTHGSKTHPERLLRGEAVTGAKLKVADVLAIRNLYAQGVTKAEIARRFDVSPGSAGKVIANRTWAHVPLEHCKAK